MISQPKTQKPAPPVASQAELNFAAHLPAGRQWFTLRELSGYWSISVDQLYRLAEAGEFEAGDASRANPDAAGPVNFAAKPKTTRSTLRVPLAGVMAFMRRRKQ